MASDRDASIINQLVVPVFHYHSFADDDAFDTVPDDVWQFCLAAVGGAPGKKPRPQCRSASEERRARS